MIDEMVRMVSCPTLVVSGLVADDRWPPKRILVPTNGSVASRRAAEVGFALVGRSSEEVVLLNVVQSEPRPYRRGGRARATSRSLETGRQIVAELQELGEVQGARTRGLVEVGDDAETVIIDLARRQGIGMIILGTDVRPASDRLFLGPRVERILGDAPCPVVVINAS
jgi:nucleotide-binding universal stress UspA family protein